MKRTHPAAWRKGFACRGRLAVLAFSAVVAVLLVVLVLAPGRRDERIPSTVRADSSWPFDEVPLERAHPQLYIGSVSANGRWVTVASTVDGLKNQVVFFDVESRRFARIAPGFEALVPRRWTPQRILVTRVVEGTRSRKRPFYEYDVLRGKATFLFDEVTPPRFILGCCGGGPQPEVFGVQRYFIAAKARHIFYVALRKRSKRDFTREFVVFDKETGTKTVLAEPEGSRPFGPNPWGWMPDRDMFVLTKDALIPSVPPPSNEIRSQSIDKLWLVDPGGRQPPVVVPVRERFLALRGSGVPASDKTGIYQMMLVAFVDNGRTARFHATFYSKQAKNDPRQDRSSVWDLDLETGNLERVMDLTFGPIYHSSVWSRSGASLVAPISGARNALAFYSEGEKAKTLPFQIEPAGDAFGSGNRHGPTIGSEVRFLDESSLIYNDQHRALWRFDLRTWTSELLWRPEAPGEMRMKKAE